jgi:hypothetical protein
MIEENLSIKKNRTLLSQRPVLAVLSVLFLYIFTEIMSDSVVRALVPDNRGLGMMIKLIFFSFLAFFVIPILLRLPAGKSSIRSYFEGISLKSEHPLGWLLFLLSPATSSLPCSKRWDC